MDLGDLGANDFDISADDGLIAGLLCLDIGQL